MEVNADMINRIQEDVMSDARIQERVKENKQVAWFVNDSNVRGVGRIRNISISGMLIETEQPIDPHNHKQFTFAADLGHDNFVPQRGRLIWSKPKAPNSKKYLCGVRFEEPSEYILPKLEDRIQKKMQTSQNLGVINQVLDWTLFVAILGMTGYTIWMSVDTYQHMKKTNAMMEAVTTQQAELISTYKNQLETVNEELVMTSSELVTVKGELAEAQQRIAQLELDLQEARLMYNESEQMVAAINKDLEATRQTLAETEGLLQQARANQAQAGKLSSEEQQQFAERSQRLTATVSQLESENEDLKNLMRKLESQLAYYQGDVKNSEDGEELIRTYKRNIELVKSKIKQFQKDARQVMRSAQKERDQLQMVLGNNGYFMKNGETVTVDEEKYIAAGQGAYTGDVSADQTANVEKRKVDVNVEFVEK